VTVKWSGPTWVAVILAIGVSIGLVEAIYYITRDITEPGATALGVVVGAIVGAISTYLGLHREDDQ